MLNKLFLGVAVVGLVFLGVMAFGGNGGGKLGAANVTPYNALNQQALVNELNLIANPLVAVIDAKVTWNPASTGGSSVSSSIVTVDVPTAGAALGDPCFTSLSSATSTSATYSCSVSAAGTSTVTEFVTGGAAVDVATGTLDVKVFPATGFVAPVGL